LYWILFRWCPAFQKPKWSRESF